MLFSGKYNTHFLNYSNEFKVLLHKMIQIHPRQRLTIKGVLNSRYVDTKMKEMNISLKHSPVKHNFYSNCYVPKTSNGWTSLVQVLVDENSTVDLTREEKEERKKIANFKLCQYGNLLGKLSEYKKKLLDAQKEVDILTEKIKNIEDEIKKVVPSPPSNMPPLFKSPRKK